MLRRFEHLNAWLLLCLGVAVGGCSSADDAAPAEETAVATEAAASTEPAGTADKPAPQTSSTPATPTPAAAKNAPQADATAAVAAFSPPFPDRQELFEAPKRAQGAVRQSDNEGQTVELKGFITVDTPRAVLSIDGVFSSVPVGGEKYGVQVLSIQPPSAVLQRGRNRWTATLE